MAGIEISQQVLAGGESVKIAISSVSAQSAALTPSAAAPVSLLSYTVTVDVTCFVRQGVNPTALSDGTDQILLGGNTYRLTPIVPGNKLAFITSAGSGFAYLTPNS